ncbi:MAG TPA: PilZ domain-containing protein [Steroidobacteraceae bacterium]|jgi:hypothetical protein
MEHRFGERLPARLAVHVSGPRGLTLIGQIRDISSSGALVSSEHRLGVGSRIVLRLDVPEAGAHLETQIVGEVVREVLAGFAVEWQELSPPGVRMILRQLAVREAAARRVGTALAAYPPSAPE